MTRPLLSAVFVLSFAALAGAIPEPPTLTLTSPAGGETWAAGSLHAITWKAGGQPDPLVHVETSTDGGKAWTAVGKVAGSTGSLLWKVPAATTDNCLVRLTAPRVP